MSVRVGLRNNKERRNGRSLPALRDLSRGSRMGKIFPFARRKRAKPAQQPLLIKTEDHERHRALGRL